MEKEYTGLALKPLIDLKAPLASPTFTGTVTLSGLTAGSVPFAGAGGVISQNNANLFWDDVNKRFGLGTITPAGLIHAYNNAAGNALIHGRFENIHQGGRAQFIVTSGAYPENFFSLMTHGTTVTDNYYASTGGFNDAGKAVLLGQGTSMREFVIGTYGDKPLGFFTNSTTRMVIRETTGNVGIGTTVFGTSAAKVLGLGLGTAPTTSPADMFQMMALDIVAGNTAPHFRTEAGHLVKLFSGASIADATDAASAITQLNLLLARTRANGLILT